MTTSNSTNQTFTHPLPSTQGLIRDWRGYLLEKESPMTTKDVGTG